ncbi:hypothetical protein OSC52_12025 [Clostridium pasteurianum]|uniref:hypothetical protein n=1 Tax=Clostridium pasteurianum TaxID=1501 RepID=UPI002260F20D|nr:hypothetical protein [Clostridium pasteurianum]UZW12583.1 hypothetical protein OSC52_12025 [Clostridium pasteurianum]
MDKLIPDKLTQEELKYIIRNSELFFSALNAYNGINNEEANNFLHLNLDVDEKKCLYKALLSGTGWYYGSNNEDALKLKLIAYALGITHNVFSYKSKVQQRILKLKGLSKQEQLLLMSAFLKQKLITAKTFLNTNHSNKITLYRGLKSIESKQYYYTSNLESWTSNDEVAKKFAGSNGFILINTFSTNQIFAYKNSVYRDKYNMKFKVKNFIEDEFEYIVENNQRIIELRYGNNIYKYRLYKRGE